MSANTATETGASVPQPDASWELALDVVEVPEDAFLVDVDGFEGPLDLLLALARTQKVDLSRISILALVEQYLSFISSAATMRLDDAFRRLTDEEGAPVTLSAQGRDVNAAI